MTARRPLRPLAVGVPLLAAVLVLSGCGGSSGGSAGGSTPTSGSTPTGAASGPAGNRQPGVFGLVAQITGKTLQVQSTTSQTAVTYTATTRFTATVATTEQAVKVGSCVVARSASSDGGSTARPTAPPTPATAITATVVTVSAPVAGRCTAGTGFVGGGFGFRGAGGATGAPTGVPGGAPSGAPSGGPRVGGAFGADLAIGRVTAVSGSGFTVAAQSFRPLPGAAGATASGTPSVSTRSVTVTVTGSTTYTTTRAATAAALAVGRCVAARGAADSTGAVTATSIAITPATSGSCTVRGA